MSKQYRNSPIKEAVCEFRFELESTFDQEIIDFIFSGIKDKFPDKKKGQMHQMEVKSDLKENKQEFSKSSREFDQFFSEDKKTLVQLDKGRLSVHRLKPYQSWQEFYPLIKLVFDSYTKNIKVKSIQRIGLRYINNFEIPAQSFDPKEYFNLRPIMTGKMPQTLASFFIGTIFVFENGRDNTKVQLADKLSSSDKAPFILDIDYFLAQPNTIAKDKIDTWLTVAHKNIENIFETALTEKAKELFN